MSKRIALFLLPVIAIEIIFPPVYTLMLTLVGNLTKIAGGSILTSIWVILFLIDIWKPAVIAVVFSHFVSSFDHRTKYIFSKDHQLERLIASTLISTSIFITQIIIFYYTVDMPFRNEKDQSFAIIYMLTILLMVILIPIQFVILSKRLYRLLNE